MSNAEMISALLVNARNKNLNAANALVSRVDGEACGAEFCMQKLFNPCGTPSCRC
jgi:hypothetical protein